ncbi:MAG: diguanylate cyclase [Steroidobacteraceae bacterium]
MSFFRLPPARWVLPLLLAGQPLLAAAPAAAPDSIVEGLLAEATVALRHNANQTRRLAEQALQRLAAQPDVDQEFRARLLLCEYYSERDLAALEQQVGMMQGLQARLRRQGLRAGLLTCRGEGHEMQAENAEALALYDQAVSTATSAQDDEMLAGALFARGFMHDMQGSYAQGLADLRRAQELYEKTGLSLHALNALNGIATAYNRMGDSTQAYEIYSRALQKQRAAGLLRDTVVTEHNMGRVSERIGNWRQARQSFESAYRTSREIDYARGQAYALRGLAAVALARGDAQAALGELRHAHALQQEQIDTRLGALISLTEAMAQRSLGQLMQARQLLASALAVFRGAGAQLEMVAAYEQLALVDSELGDWRRAFQWQDAAKATSEQLLRNQIDQHFAVLKVEFDTATREKEYGALLRESMANQKLLEQTRRARNLQYVVSGLIVLLAGLLATLALHHNRNSRRMRHLALTDELTGVPNRRAVLSLLPVALQAGDQGVAAVLLDIDHFKRINDTFGHVIGDRVLGLVAGRLKAMLQPPEFLGRIGGEEFLVVIPGTDLRLATARAETLRTHVSATDIASIAPELGAITVSIGVAMSRPGDSVSALLQRADGALYRAKASGRDRVVTAQSPHPRLQEAL